MNKIGTFFFILIISISINSQWLKYYNGTASLDDFSQQVTIDNLGNVYVTGHSRGFFWDYATIKYNSLGVQQWVATYNNTGNGNTDDEATAIAVDNQGNVYVTGESEKTELSWLYDILTVKYNSAGVQQWAARYSGLCCIGTSIAFNKFNGNIYVTGHSGNEQCMGDIVTIKYNSDGVQQWVTTYHSEFGDSYPNMVIVNPSDYVYITGKSQGNETGYDYITILYDGAGTQQWIARYNGSANQDDFASSMTLDGYHSCVYVTGSSVEASPAIQYSITTIKYDPYNSSNNGLQWVSNFYPPINVRCAGTSISVFNRPCGGSIGDYPCWVFDTYITGYCKDQNGNDNFTTIKYNPDGLQQWVDLYHGTGDGDNSGNCIAVDNLGNAYVTGYSTEQFGNHDYTTIKFDPSGGRTIFQPYNGSGNQNDESNSIVVDNSGNIYTTGVTYNKPTAYNDYLTITYLQSWVESQTNVNNNLNSIYKTNSNTYLISGDNGLILKTTNNGQNWVTQPTNTNKNLNRIFFINPTTGIAIGDSSTVLLTTDGGVNWINRSLNSSLNLYGIIFTNSNNIFITGENGKLFHSSDAGNSWISYSTAVLSSLRYIVFEDFNHGFIVGDAGKVFKTTNGGMNWTILPSFTSKNLNSCFMINQSEIIAIGDNGVIYYTGNGGINWVQRTFNTNKNLRGIYFVDNNSGYIVGDGGLILSTGDRGYTWYAQKTNTMSDINSIYCININDGIAITKNGTILHRMLLYDYGVNDNAFSNNNNKVLKANPYIYQLEQNYPNPFNPITKIKYQISESSNVQIHIYDILGKEIYSYNDFKQLGSYEIQFDGTNFASGVYFYKLIAGDFESIKRMVLIK